MNEKIKQLADKAGINYATGFGYSNDKVSDLQLEEFAELIVRECASRMDNILREKKDGGGTMGDEIREHFGVEE